MSTQSEALLGLAGAWAEMPADVRSERQAALHGNPVICTQQVLDDALADAEEAEAAALETMRNDGLLVVADEPKAERARLAGQRPGYLNRAARRKLRRRP